MKSHELKTRTAKQVIIRKCHVCGQVMESEKEVTRCISCNKQFMPLNYFGKLHAKTEREFGELFADSDELHPEDLIKGLFVLW